MTFYVTNAISINMLMKLIDNIGSCRLTITPSTYQEMKQDRPFSFIGHEEVAKALHYPLNRKNLSLTRGDVLYVALEGETRNSENFEFKILNPTEYLIYRVDVL